MPIVPVFGHDTLKAKIRQAAGRGALPSSILIEGPRGVGKQRLAIWIAQLLLCQGPSGADRPCLACQSCRFVDELRHPDLVWFFPRPRKEADLEPAAVLDDYREAIAERVEHHGLYAPPSGMEGIFIGATRALVRSASLSPTIGRRKVYVIGDAERMVSQEGSDQAANAFLKLLEEPPQDTTIILTSSEPGSLLPTIRSRVVTFRASSLPDEAIRAFLANEQVKAAVNAIEALPRDLPGRVRFAAGAPGRLLDAESRVAARESARRILEAATGKVPDRYRAAFSQSVAGARGQFSDTLDELTVLLHDRVREAVEKADSSKARAASRAIDFVEEAKLMASGNVNPQLVTASLLGRIASELR